LAQRPHVPTAALITDVGNDILYGAAQARIADWVEECLQRLDRVSSHVVVTELPLASLAHVGRLRFLLMRTILFPKSRVTLSGAMDSARQLNHRLRELARRYDARLVKPHPGWYGFDPIHIRRRCVRVAWQTLLSAWSQEDAPIVRSHSWRERWMLLRLRPQQRRWLGVEQSRTQPAGFLDDGSPISLY